MSNKQIISKVIIVLCLYFITVSITYAQVQFNSPKVILKLGSGYDSNPLLMSEESDSIRLSSLVEQFGARMYSKVNWSKRVRTLISANGEYILYPNHSKFNEWSLGMKLNNVIKLYPKYKRTWKPGILLNFGILTDVKDKYFTNRELGEEFETIISPNEKLGLGNYLDVFSVDLFTGLGFNFGRFLNLNFGWKGANNNYKDLVSKDVVKSLDNKESSLFSQLGISIFKMWSIQLYFNRKYRQYDFKLAKNLSKKEIGFRKREYNYTTYGIGTELSFEKFNLIFDYSLKYRDDLFEGYYNYTYDDFDAEIMFNISQSLEAVFFVSISKKAYDNYTTYNELLKNDYLQFRFSLPIKLYDPLVIEPAFIYDSENSTNPKYTYTSNYISIMMTYR
ncbi:MAG: hypothetical protein GXO85_04355, partial [Chlorobi bacterium]|nr:hypothetical protein [Chlorobiota bacterium]